MEMVIRIMIIANIILYGFAFVMGYNRGQALTTYFVCLAVQVLLIVMQLNQFGYSGKGDAAGNGMEAGLLALMYFAMHVVVVIVLIVVFVRKNV